jgi:hypothetical protein
VALRTPEKALLGPFRTPYRGRIRAPSVARTLFGQFQKKRSRKSVCNILYRTVSVGEKRAAKVP